MKLSFMELCAESYETNTCTTYSVQKDIAGAVPIFNIHLDIIDIYL